MIAEWSARSCSARPGSHFSETRSGSPARLLMAKILPATLKTELSGLLFRFVVVGDVRRRGEGSATGGELTLFQAVGRWA